MLTDRLIKEIEILKKYYPSIILNNNQDWAMIPAYNIPKGYGWIPESIPICFMIPSGYPGANPYGIYVPSEIKIDGQPPNNFQKIAGNVPPFAGTWGVLSWILDPWKPTADIQKGSNLLNFVQSFKNRFISGK